MDKREKVSHALDYLPFMVDEQIFGIPLQHVHSVRSTASGFSDTTNDLAQENNLSSEADYNSPPPSTRQIQVIDLANLFWGYSSSTSKSYILVTTYNIGFVVDQVFSVNRSTVDDVILLPETLGVARRYFLHAIGSTNHELHLIINVEPLSLAVQRVDVEMEESV